MSGWIPKEEDLNRYMQGQLEAAYQGRHRVRCSREDFADGWLACLKALRSSSSFRPGTFEPLDDAAPADRGPGRRDSGEGEP